MILQKRDNMGFQIAPSLIIFLVIIAAGGLVCCGFAVMRFYDGDLEHTPFARSPEQEAYMREVRERNFGKLQLSAHRLYAAPNRELAHAHAPLSVSASNTTYG